MQILHIYPHTPTHLLALTHSHLHTQNNANRPTVMRLDTRTTHAAHAAASHPHIHTSYVTVQTGMSCHGRHVKALKKDAQRPVGLPWADGRSPPNVLETRRTSLVCSPGASKWRFLRKMFMSSVCGLEIDTQSITLR